MVGGGAVGVDAADIGAGVNALLLLADAVARALGVHVALWLAVGRLAHKARQTGALPSPLASHIHVEVVIPTASHRTNSSIAVDVGATSAGRG